MILILGVVIANWNGENLIGKCLESFKKQTFKEFKIYIIDNGSKDKSVELIEKYKDSMPLKLIKLNKNEGFAKANNIGIAQAIKDNATHILTINNDTEIEEFALENLNIAIKKDFKSIYQLVMINYYDRNKCDAAGICWDKTLLPKQIGYKEDITYILEREIKLMGACAGAAVYPVEALNNIKLKENEYFDNNFFAYYEDVDLAIRLFNAGYKTKILKKSIVYHVHSATGKRSNGFKEYYLYRNMFLYTKRNQSKVEYKKNKKVYYRAWLGGVKSNIANLKIIKSILKGGIDGIKNGRNGDV
ncbi:MAG: glycosyltransferase family 2 protein [Sarcina sp.]